LKKERGSDRGKLRRNSRFPCKKWGIIVGGGQVSGRANEFSLANLSNQYENTLLAQLLRIIL
jgi:hypothetical protein